MPNPTHVHTHTHTPISPHKWQDPTVVLLRYLTLYPSVKKIQQTMDRLPFGDCGHVICDLHVPVLQM